MHQNLVVKTSTICCIKETSEQLEKIQSFWNLKTLFNLNKNVIVEVQYHYCSLFNFFVKIALFIYLFYPPSPKFSSNL